MQSFHPQLPSPPRTGADRGPNQRPPNQCERQRSSPNATRQSHHGHRPAPQPPHAPDLATPTPGASMAVARQARNGPATPRMPPRANSSDPIGSSTINPGSGASITESAALTERTSPHLAGPQQPLPGPLQAPDPAPPSPDPVPPPPDLAPPATDPPSPLLKHPTTDRVLDLRAAQHLHAPVPSRERCHSCSPVTSRRLACSSPPRAASLAEAPRPTSARESRERGETALPPPSLGVGGFAILPSDGGVAREEGLRRPTARDPSGRQGGRRWGHGM